MSEEEKPRRGENRIYKLIDRGPIFLGLPIIQGALVGGITGIGYWPVRYIFGNFAGLLWLGLGVGCWAVVGFINAQDKTYIHRLHLKLSGIVMKDHITSYVPSDQTIEVE